MLTKLPGRRIVELWAWYARFRSAVVDQFFGCDGMLQHPNMARDLSELSVSQPLSGYVPIQIRSCVVG